MIASDQIFFITATDTSAGKTVLTSLLAWHYRRLGERVLVCKPFCSGSREDANLARACSSEKYPLSKHNPYYYQHPVTPLLGARIEGVKVQFGRVINWLQGLYSSAELAKGGKLLIEGAGGLCSPLGEGFDALDIIRELKPNVVLVAPNRLGVLSHTKLALSALRALNLSRITVVLMNLSSRQTLAMRSNAQLLREICDPTPVVVIPYIQPRHLRSRTLKRTAKNFEETLASI